MILALVDGQLSVWFSVLQLVSCHDRNSGDWFQNVWYGGTKLRRVVDLHRFQLAMLLYAWNHYQIVNAVSSSGVVVTLEIFFLGLGYKPKNALLTYKTETCKK